MNDTKISPQTPGGAETPPPHNATLYAARLADPRERAAVPRELTRGRAARRASATSDVTRFSGVLAAAATGAAAVLAAMVMFPPPGGISASSPGPLSRPHERAKLECASCHADPAVRPRSSAAKPSARPLVPNACVTCHGPHTSTRAGHQRMAAEGQLSCPSCHAIHRADQGVTFAPEGFAVRFAPGVEISEPSAGFHPARPTTVPIVSAASCARCHSLDARNDPVARCLLPDQKSLGDARPSVCFDEHQPSLPADREAPGPRPGGVCASQHGTDRAAAWEAAREVAARTPILTARAAGSGPLGLWLGAGAGGAALGLAFARVTRAWLTWRRKPHTVPGALVKPPTRVRLPTIDTSTCLGCYACVDACPYNVLEIERYVAVVARPEACCGLTLCEQRCPNGSLAITDGDPIGDRPRLDDHLESLDTPGLYLAGDVTGLPLIKNAIHQGSAVVNRIAASLRGAAASPGALDLVVVGAGPAGISAALRAKELGLAFEVIEQGNVAQSIQSFPRGKLVFDQPLDLPVAGKLWLRESSKEELLAHWTRIVRQERLPIRADTRMTALERGANDFTIVTEPREGGPPRSIRARRVLLAIGQRGQPRRLPFELSPDIEPRVHYHLSDAKSFENMRVVVVGLGDVAMEAVIALSRQPGTQVTVVHRGDGFHRGKTRNIDEVRRLSQAGRIAMLLETEIQALSSEAATLRGPSAEVRTLPYDAVLVLIGNIPPWSTLRAAGIRAHADLAGDRTPGPDVREEARPA